MPTKFSPFPQMEPITDQNIMAEFHYNFPGEQLSESGAALTRYLIEPYVNAFKVVKSYDEWIVRYISQPYKQTFRENLRRLTIVYNGNHKRIQYGLINMLIFILLNHVVVPTCGCKAGPWDIAEGVEKDEGLKEMMGPIEVPVTVNIMGEAENIIMSKSHCLGMTCLANKVPGVNISVYGKSTADLLDQTQTGEHSFALDLHTYEGDILPVSFDNPEFIQGINSMADWLDVEPTSTWSNLRVKGAGGRWYPATVT